MSLLKPPHTQQWHERKQIACKTNATRKRKATPIFRANMSIVALAFVGSLRLHVNFNVSTQ